MGQSNGDVTAFLCLISVAKCIIIRVFDDNFAL